MCIWPDRRRPPAREKAHLPTQCRSLRLHQAVHFGFPRRGGLRLVWIPLMIVGRAEPHIHLAVGIGIHIDLAEQARFIAERAADSLDQRGKIQRNNAEANSDLRQILPARFDRRRICRISDFRHCQAVALPETGKAPRRLGHPRHGTVRERRGWNRPRSRHPELPRPRARGQAGGGVDPGGHGDHAAAAPRAALRGGRRRVRLVLRR